MALQQRPDGYEKAKEELLQYWQEPGTIIPLEEFPFVWPETPPFEPTIPPDVREAMSPFNLSLDETWDLSDGHATYLDNLFTASNTEDILNTRKSTSLDLVFLTPRVNGPDRLRKYGPRSIEKAAISFPSEALKGEDGMEIPRDTSDVIKAFEKDERMKVTQEDADYLRFIISKIREEKSVDVILPKVPSRRNSLKVA
jgi:hypothetical protein